ncbi:hypothetical protein AB1K70_21315 [Bremerella sp. JC770]|uniref:hypothetical protein n=1 Tax=Bremerella sp. JC770 TaxID=3232137 RepID=UPI0034587653
MVVSVIVLVLAAFAFFGIRNSIGCTPVSVVVQIHLSQLGQAMSVHAANVGRVDWPSLDAMQADVKAGGHYSIPPKFQHGFDVWGSKIVLIKDVEAKRWILRSYGPNRRDDNGEGDDIQEDTRGTW